MAYCRKCGFQIDDEAVICPKCGVAQQQMRYNDGLVEVQEVPMVLHFLGWLFL